jgi:hypothetical protein
MKIKYAAMLLLFFIFALNAESAMTLVKYLKKNRIKEAKFSTNGKYLVTHKMIKQGENSYLNIINIWDLTKKNYPVLRLIDNHWELFSLKRNFAFSGDEKYIAYKSDRIRTGVVIEKLNVPNSKSTQKFKGTFTQAISLNFDGSKLLRAYSDDYTINQYIEINDSKTGKLISDKTKISFRIRQVVFNNYGSSVALMTQYSSDNSKGIKKNITLFDSTTMKKIKYWFDKGYDQTFFLKDHGVIISGLSEISIYDYKTYIKRVANKKYKNSIVALSPKDNTEIGLVANGEFNLISIDKENYFKELKETKLEYTPLSMCFLKKQNRWMFVSENNIEYAAHLSDTTLQANSFYNQGLKMLKAGFYKPGMKKIIEAIKINPLTHSDSIVSDLTKNREYPLYIAGQALLKQYQQCKPKYPKDAMIALFNYAYLAAGASHLNLTQQAIDEIKKNAMSEPNQISKSNVKMITTSLEALIIANRENPEAAYNYILSNGGIASKDFLIVKNSILTMPEYWYLLYTDRGNCKTII